MLVNGKGLYARFVLVKVRTSAERTYRFLDIAKNAGKLLFRRDDLFRQAVVRFKDVLASAVEVEYEATHHISALRSTAKVCLKTLPWLDKLGRQIDDFFFLGHLDDRNNTPSKASC